jgi:pimeloyl-ACP methyl ester carboxylesterase
MEKVYKLGKNKNLVAIALEPDNFSNSVGKPAVIFLNSGLLHRVGPFRLNVDMSRKLGLSGYYTIRFDVSGIGDSLIHKDSINYAERIKNDVIEVIDFFQEKTGINQFILIGLCAGAENAHAVAVEDKRVSGIVMIDGFTYPTLFYYLVDYIPYFLNYLRLTRSIIKRVKRTKRLFEKQCEIDVTSHVFVRTFPPRKKIAGELEEMARRGLFILNIYSGKIAGYNYASQYKTMFRDVNFRGRMKLVFYKDADHTFSSISERKKMMDCIFDWLNETFGEA